MALTQEEIKALARILDAKRAEREGLAKAAKERLRRLALDPIKRRKTFKIVPGAALSREAARLAQFYEQAWPEQRAALDTLMTLFTAGISGVPPRAS